MRLYNRYNSQRGFPVAMQLENNSLAHHGYLEGILNTVLLKDVAQRCKITNLYALEVLVQYLFDNIGNLTSIKRIADTMTSFGIKISTISDNNPKTILTLDDCYSYFVDGIKIMNTLDYFME